MTSYAIVKVHDGVYLPTPQPVTLPAMQPGDSVRVTMREDGTFDVVPLERLGLTWHKQGRKEAVWADAPEQERSDSQENDR